MKVAKVILLGADNAGKTTPIKFFDGTLETFFKILTVAL